MNGARTIGTLRALAALLAVGGMAAAGELAPKASAAPARSLSATSLRFLALAESGTVQAKRFWWNTKLGWYQERLSARWSSHQPLVTLWSAYPLFETLSAIAIADPTASHRSAVDAFAARAETYFNPAVGGYAYYPGTRATVRTYFDDNGWWAIAFLDAYRATGNRRYLTDAGRALEYIAAQGWDPVSGGTWWESGHLHKTAEPLAAAVYAGAALYRATGEHRYRDTALKYLAWANANSWNATRQLYARSPTSPETLDYVQGMMIGAHLELCQVTGNGSYCTKADRLARASLVAFPMQWNWTPSADAVYLRFLLDLYRQNRDPRLYRFALQKAHLALANGRSPNGIFSRDWQGRAMTGGLLRTQAASLSLLAWLAAAPSPSVALRVTSG